MEKQKQLPQTRDEFEAFLIHWLKDDQDGFSFTPDNEYEWTEGINIFLDQYSFASLEQIADSKPELFIAKSGRKYRHIPDDMDIETWDAMTPVQRIEYKGLLRNAPVFDSKEIPAGAEAIPEWIIKYDQANYQSSAGKAVRFLMDYIKQVQSTPAIAEGKGLPTDEEIKLMAIDYMKDHNHHLYGDVMRYFIAGMKTMRSQLQSLSTKEPTPLRDELIKDVIKIVDEYLNSKEK